MDNQPHTSEQPATPSAWANASFLFLLGVFVGGGLYCGGIFLDTVRQLAAPPPAATARSPRSTVEEPAVTSVGSTVRGVLGMPTRPAVPPPGDARPASAPTPEATDPLPVWDGTDRVTILLLGIDQRDDERAAGVPSRSDTMILLTVDPLNKTAAMLSLPRDLWVPIRAAGQSENKLNTAHFYGELAKPGTGPEAARRTIQYNFGVPIHYVARVDFSGFIRLIDAIGGITIDVDRAILDDEYPNEEYGITRLYVAPGPQRMSGAFALKYARTRHADSDFGRVTRQRRVLQAAREEVLDLNLIPRLPQMLGIVMQSVTTDIPITRLLALANLGRQIPASSIVTRQIDDTMLDDVNRDGSVLLPDRGRIRDVVRELFYDPIVRQEAARIEILNATGRAGLATAVRAGLTAQSYNVVRADTADRADRAETTIVGRATKKATIEHLATALGVASRNVRLDGQTGDADITVTLGADFRAVR